MSKVLLMTGRTGSLVYFFFYPFLFSIFSTTLPQCDSCNISFHLNVVDCDVVDRVRSELGI